MPYPINQRAQQFNSIQSVPVSFGLWDMALKFLSPGPRSDVTDHLARRRHLFEVKEMLYFRCSNLAIKVAWSAYISASIYTLQQ